jgi:UDP-glucose 4-epimerase
MRCLVTGGAGFIGSHIVRALLQRGDEVVVIDNLATGHRANLGEIRQDFLFVEGDICNLEDVRAAIQGCEVVYHQAALPSVPRSMKNPIESHESNLTGTLNVLWAAHHEGVRRVVSASSSSVYGDTPKMPKSEGDELFPKSPYAATKLALEIYSQTFTRAYGLETVCLRYFNVFGPRQDPDSPYAAVVPIWLRRMSLNQAPVVYGDGQQSRDFAYIDNVVDANLAAADAPEASGLVFNIAGGERVVLLDMAHELMRLYDFDGEIEFAAPRPGDILHSSASLDLAHEKLGFQPRLNWRAGLAETVAWFNTSNPNQ